MASSTIKRPVSTGIVDTNTSNRIMCCASVNYGTTLVLNKIPTSNTAGIIIVGGGNDVGLFAFSVRPADERIAVYKIGGDSNVTITATVTADGDITFTTSRSTQFTVYYSSY